MTAILRRELGAYFRSPIGYIYLSVFYVLGGFFFTIYALFQNSTDMAAVFSQLVTIVLFLIPILTMRLFSEDNKNKTDQVLLTAPVSLTGVVMGKFLAALLVFALGLAIILVYTVVIAVFAPPDWANILSNLLAMLLLGAAIIAIGMLISSLTENQVIAATGGFAVAFLLLLVDVLSSMTQNQLLSKLFSAISFYSRYSTFTTGVFDFSNILYFASVSFLFIFLTVRVLEKRRWA